MTDQGRGRTAGGTSREASPEDMQEQSTPAVSDERDDIPPRYGIPAEADEADAADQLRSAPFDDDDRR